MAGINKVILIGNLGKDPEVRTLESGAKVANFSLATTESYRNKNGERVDTTEWHNIVLWRGLADVAESYLKKGSQIYVEGRIRTRSWDDKDGNKRYTTEIQGDVMTMLGSRGQAEQTAPASNNQPNPAQNNTNLPAPDGVEDDLPF